MYATIAQLRLKVTDEDLIQLTDRADPPSGQMDEGVITAALVSATNIINGYVAAQYQVPLPSNPPLLADLACDIAHYRLWKNAPDHVRQAYDDAVKSLTNISKGLMRLPIEDGSGQLAQNEPDGRDGVMVIQSEGRRFSRSSMGGL